MMINSPLKFKFTFLLVLLGFIATAQKIDNTNSSFGAFEYSKANLIVKAVQEPSNSFDYSGYVVSRKTGEPIENARIEMKNLISGINTILRTDKKGYYKLSVVGNEKLKLEVYGEGHSKESRIVKISKNLSSSSNNNRIYLTPFESLVEKEGSVQKIKVDPIHFDSDNAAAKGLDEVALEKVLFTMLKFPEIRIKIESHSNKGGTEVANSVLSYFHAKSARRFLIKQGINPNRIEIGKSQDISPSKKDCIDGINCDNQEAFVSEKSDFIIVQNN